MKKWTESQVKAMQDKQIFLTQAKTGNMPNAAEVEELMLHFQPIQMKTHWKEKLPIGFKNIVSKKWISKDKREEIFLKYVNEENELLYSACFEGFRGQVVLEHISLANRQNKETIFLNGECLFKKDAVVKLFLQLNETYSEEVFQTFAKLTFDQDGVDEFFERMFFKLIETNEAMKLKEIFKIEDIQFEFEHWNEKRFSLVVDEEGAKRELLVYVNGTNEDIQIEKCEDGKYLEYHKELEEICERSGINVYTFARKGQLDILNKTQKYFAQMVIDCLEKDEENRIKLLFNDTLRENIKKTKLKLY